MRIISGAVPGVSRLARLQVELSKRARQRLKWFERILKLREEYPRWGKDKLVILLEEKGY